MGLDRTGLTTLGRAIDAVRSDASIANLRAGSMTMRDVDDLVPIFARDAPGEHLAPVTRAAER